MAIRRNCNEEQYRLNVQLHLTLLCKGRYVFSWQERTGEFPYFFRKKVSVLSLNMNISRYWMCARWNKKIGTLRSFSLYCDYSYPNPYFVKCRRTLLKLNFKGPWSSSEREIQFRRCLFTSSIKRKIRHSVSRRSRANTGKKCTKLRDARAKLLFCLLTQLFFFLTFSLPPASLDLKFPNAINQCGILTFYGWSLNMGE